MVINDNFTGTLIYVNALPNAYDFLINCHISGVVFTSYFAIQSARLTLQYWWSPRIIDKWVVMDLSLASYGPYSIIH